MAEETYWLKKRILSSAKFEMYSDLKARGWDLIAWRCLWRRVSTPEEQAVHSLSVSLLAFLS